MNNNIVQMMKSAEEGRYAIGAFNIFNYLSAKAVVDACEEVRSPVILQLSVKTVKQLGLGSAIRSILDLAEKATVPATVHLDHCKDLQFALGCIEFGFPSIMLDGSSYELEHNIAITREAKIFAKRYDCAVEGELGAIGGVEEDIVVAEGTLASVEASIRFVNETGVDLFAPAIGTAHGIYRGEPVLDVARFIDIKSSVHVPLVIHGGTGLSKEVLHELIAQGASKINISTALKQAYINTARETLRSEPSLTEPLSLDERLSRAIRQTTKDHVYIFKSANRV